MFETSDFLTSMSIITALMFSILGFLERKRSKKREYTTNLLKELSTCSNINEADVFMARIIFEKKSLSSETISAKDDCYVITILDYYDFLSRATLDKVVDQKVLFDQRGKAMLFTYQVCEEYIGSRRKHLNTPDLYSNFEQLVNWIKVYRSKNGLVNPILFENRISSSFQKLH